MLDSRRQTKTRGGILSLSCIICAGHGSADGPDALSDASPATALIVAPDLTLTPTEERVLATLYCAPSNMEIAALLHMAPRTVKFHITNLRAKIGGLSRLGLCLLSAMNRQGIPSVCLSCADAFAKPRGLDGDVSAVPVSCDSPG
ncbi:helix-turn-helix transcriptional regulator [Streptomyces sp. Q6]|uniref:Helix-turn-helix transcriptional regulator n=1 Tax=Streptomyces citrinus TaxID=3118173 RepID=A0ACD5ACG4_9ACTN